jgi:hypothetical protein
MSSRVQYEHVVVGFVAPDFELAATRAARAHFNLASPFAIRPSKLPKLSPFASHAIALSREPLVNASARPVGASAPGEQSSLRRGQSRRLEPTGQPDQRGPPFVELAIGLCVCV